MLTFASRTLSDSNVVELYDWAESSPSAVLRCTNRQVSRLPSIPQFSHALGGQSLYLHYQTPGLIAQVCGMIVGILPKDDHVAYELDDGTAVLRILMTRKSLQLGESLKSSSAPDNQCGVPECYRVPPRSKTDRARPGDATSSKLGLPPFDPQFNVGDVVLCVGKIQVARSKDRFLVARAMSACQDANDESRHHIQVVELEKSLYRRPFEWERIGTSKKATPPSLSRRADSSSHSSARSLLTNLAPERAEAATLDPSPHFEKRETTGETRLTRDEARRLLTSDNLSSPPASSSTPTTRPCPSGSSSSRKLRRQAKIPDHHLSESYFQLQLQQHISQSYQNVEFTLSDLCEDGNLSCLARRLVNIRLQLRSSSHRTAVSNLTPQYSSERFADKSRRLFEWAIRKMMHDGFITISASAPMRSSLSSSSASSSADGYRLVTPEYLIDSLRKVLGPVANVPSHDIDDVTARLRFLDERFRFLNRSVVQDGLALYFHRYAPIVLD